MVNKSKTQTTSNKKRSSANIEKALRGRCEVRFDHTRASLGGITASLLTDLSHESNRYVCEFLLTPERQRISYGVGGKSELTVVHLGKHGSLLWDRSTRTEVRLPSDAFPRTSLAPSGKIDVEEREEEEQTTYIFTAQDSSMGRIRHELTVSARKDLAPFGPSLMKMLHCGPTCHSHTGLPYDRIANAGLIVREKTTDAESGELISELIVESLEMVRVKESDFSPPKGYRPLEEVMQRGVREPVVPPPAKDAPNSANVQMDTIQQALDGPTTKVRDALRILDNLTPDCLGSTRFGSLTAFIHQDLLSVASNAINTCAPLLGPTAIAGGTWTVPWLANLAGIVSTTAPGTGMFSFLRVPRVVTSPPGTTGGGIGLLDRLAFRTLYERDGSGTIRTQREFAAGTLAATLTSWGVAGTAAATSLIAASGDLTMIILPEQRTIVEGYERRELGVFTVTGLPATVPPMTSPPLGVGSMTFAGITTPPLFNIRVTGIAGTVNFASLGGGPLITAATVGNSGNFVLGLSVPSITFTATIARGVTWFGSTVLTVGSIGFCFAFPLLCPLAITLVVLAAFILNNVTVVTATATGVTWTLNVRFDFDPTTERVEPFVSLLSRTGTVTVSTFGPTPNIIANAVDSLVAAIGNLFDGWGALLADQGSKAIQQALRDQGLQLPVAGRQNEFRAVGGSAQSSTGGILQLSADIEPVDNVSSQPYTTQVDTSDGIRQQLLQAHLKIRQDLNPQVPPPPGPGPAITVGTFASLGLSQNALNYYIFHQWVQGRFEVATTDPAIINRFVTAAPQLFVRFPARVHLWPATAPRVEIAPHEIALKTRPLVVFFDDVRACFEVPTSRGGSDTNSATQGLWELSCNFKSSATIELAWPWVFSLRVDPVRASLSPDEPRTWEFVDPNVPAIMGNVGPHDLEKLVDLVADLFIAPISAVGVQAPASVRPWTRPLPALQQEVFPAIQPPAGIRAQQVYLEMMARRKALYILSAIDTVLFELFDGSGAPTLNTIILPLAGAPGPLPTTLFRMTRAQGAALRDFLLPLFGLPAGP